MELEAEESEFSEVGMLKLVRMDPQEGKHSILLRENAQRFEELSVQSNRVARLSQLWH